MIQRTFSELVQDLRQRRVVGDLPPVVLLGAGASVESGIGAMTDLFRFVGREDFHGFCEYIEPLTAPERYRLLSQFLQSQQPSEVTPGYQALAALCAEAFFDTILTTNLDPLLDDALAAAQLWRKDYLLLVNGVMRAEWLGLLLIAQSPRVKVVKLHGDLFQRCMAWTPAEMDTFLTDVSQQLHPALHTRDVLVVGHSLRDARIRELVETTSGAVWYTTPGSVPPFLSKQRRVRAVVGPECTFERLFTGLAKSLGVEAVSERATRGPAQPSRPASAAGTGAQTMDDVMASVLALEADGQRFCTGFVLAEPRVIVTDGYSANTERFISDGQVTVIAAGDRRFKTKVLRRNEAHPFGPVFVEVPEQLKVPGLRLNATRVGPNTGVRIGVAAGERVGVSSGTITSASEQRIEIAPIGRVDHLVAIEAVVAPGASGAPVVDTSMAVRGFIVAGRTDHPPCFMYPASRWADALREALGAQGTQRRDTGPKRTRPTARTRR